MYSSYRRKRLKFSNIIAYRPGDVIFKIFGTLCISARRGAISVCGFHGPKQLTEAFLKVKHRTHGSSSTISTPLEIDRWDTGTHAGAGV